ncbi:hypothetical protein CJJ07_005052 [Candidozyma auris]|nr:hypothetical protein CJJ07_005052 [[Candida] auris]QEL60907.1 hypothetical protein CJJ09_003037 [[Candida] auris]
MRFTNFVTFAIAAVASASPVVTPQIEASTNDLVVKSVIDTADVPNAIVERDEADDISHDLSKLVGDVVYDVEGIINLFGYNVTEIFNEVGLEPPADRHGEVIDGARLIIDVVKDLTPIALRFGINLLKLVTIIL